MARHILAIDQGTTNTKAVLFDERAEPVARGACPVEIAFPHPGWVEQDVRAIWRSVRLAVAACLDDAGGRRIDAVALTNQRESVLVWDRATGEPIGPVIIWQCRRTVRVCERLRDEGRLSEIESRTGLTIDPLFSASKIGWLLDAAPDGRARAARGELCAGTIDSWLIWSLTGGAVHACDATNASRTQLLNLSTVTWDPMLLDLFGVPASVLPSIKSSSEIYGDVSTIDALRGVPIASAIGDSHAALFGHGSFQPGQVKATYGTGSSLMTPLPELRHSRHGLSTTIAWSLRGDVRYAFEGNITVTGSAIEWLSRILDSDASATATATLANTVADTDGVYFVPALAGLGAPYWDADARGLMCGLSRGTTGAHLARAGVESIGYQVRDVFDAMCEDAGAPAALLADGGATQNDALMQFQADILGVPVLRSSSSEVSARGTALLAGLATGVWRSLDDVRALPHRVDRFEPAMPVARRAALYRGWQDAVSRTRSRRTITEGVR